MEKILRGRIFIYVFSDRFSINFEGLMGFFFVFDFSFKSIWAWCAFDIKAANEHDTIFEWLLYNHFNTAVHFRNFTYVNAD